jgi:hypothetical protein
MLKDLLRSHFDILTARIDCGLVKFLFQGRVNWPQLTVIFLIRG